MPDLPSSSLPHHHDDRSGKAQRTLPDRTQESWANARVHQPLQLILTATASLLRSTLSSDQRRQVEQVRASARAVQDAVTELLGPDAISPAPTTQPEQEMQGASLLARLETTLERYAAEADSREIHLGHTLGPEAGLPEPASDEFFQRILSGLLEITLELKQRGELAVLVQPGPVLHDEPSLALQVWTSGGQPSSERLLREVARALEPGKKPGERVSALTLRALALRRQLEREGSHLTLQLGGTGELIFSALIPAGPAHSVVSEPAQLPPQHSIGLPTRALMVAPDSALSASLRLTLTRLGFRSDLVSSPQHVLELCTTAASGPHPYGLLILDLALSAIEPQGLLDALPEVDPALAKNVLLVGCPSQLEFSRLLTRFPTVRTLSRPFRLTTLRERLFSKQATQAVPQAGIDPSIPEYLPEVGRVLVVEDSPINFRVLQHMLERLGLTALPASTGLEALEVLDRESVNAVLLDFQLPDLDGPEVAELIRTRSEGKAFQSIIGMTADSDDRIRQVWAKVSVHDVISKPVGLDELKRVLERLLERKLSGMAQKGGPRDGGRSAPANDLEWDLAETSSSSSTLLEPLSQCHRMLLEAFGNWDMAALREACGEMRRLGSAIKDKRLMVACDRLSMEDGRAPAATQEALARISEELSRIRAGYLAVP